MNEALRRLALGSEQVLGTEGGTHRASGLRQTAGFSAMNAASELGLGGTL